MLQKALDELGEVEGGLKFNLKKPAQNKLPENPAFDTSVDLTFEKNKENILFEQFHGEPKVQIFYQALLWFDHDFYIYTAINIIWETFSIR